MKRLKIDFESMLLIILEAFKELCPFCSKNAMVTNNNKYLMIYLPYLLTSIDQWWSIILWKNINQVSRLKNSIGTLETLHVWYLFQAFMSQFSKSVNW